METTTTTLSENKCIRLRGKNGNYVSLLACGVEEDRKVSWVDLATPEGKVLYCGVPLELVDILVEQLGEEDIKIL
jgi:hypothetical protein